MTPSTQVVLSGALTFGVPLVLAVRELFVLRRPPPHGSGGTRVEPTVPPPPKPLPDCLIPRPAPRRTRVLEDA